MSFSRAALSSSSQAVYLPDDAYTSSGRRDSSCRPFKLQLGWNYDRVLDRPELYLQPRAAIFLACRYLILARDKLFGPLFSFLASFASAHSLSLSPLFLLPDCTFSLDFFLPVDGAHRPVASQRILWPAVSVCPITIRQLKVEAVYWACSRQKGLFGALETRLQQADARLRSIRSATRNRKGRREWGND